MYEDIAMLTMEGNARIDQALKEMVRWRSSGAEGRRKAQPLATRQDASHRLH